MPVTQPPALEDAIAALIRGAHRDPFAVLGPHTDPSGATIVRAFQPAALAIELRLVATGALVPMEKRDPAGIFEARVGQEGREGRVGQKEREAQAPPVRPGGEAIPDYRLRITFPGDQVFEIDDPYRYG